MNNKIKLSLAFIVVLSLTFNYFVIDPVRSLENSEESNRFGAGYRYNIQGWVYLHIEGEPYERGYQYGYLCSDEILDLMSRWGDFGSDVKIANIFKVKTSERWWDLCKSITLKHSLKEYPEEYKQEIRGIADGVRAKGGTLHGNPIEFEDILTLNEMQGCWYRLKYLFNVFHPFRDIYHGVKNLFKQESTEEGFCSVFLATGDATTNGEMIAVHSTQPLYCLDERFNFVVDVTPSEGNRFIMAGTPPGFIWSLVNFYQNEQGIILMESTLPQGPWKNKGIPIAVRSRKAIQYSDCIDEVIDTLKTGNNGLYECEWLIGDTKTGEIASIELALYNTPVKRTYNGFYWSCNYPHNPAVKREVSGGIPTPVTNMITNVFENSKNIRAEKFQEIEQDYYGKIDIEKTKEIISIDPICRNSCDAKITSSNLIRDMGLVLHMGNPNGKEWIPSSEEKEKIQGVTTLPASGWVEIYPPNNKTNIPYKKEVNNHYKNSKVLWTCKIEEDKYKKTGLSSYEVSQDSIYVFTDSNNAYVLDKKTGQRKSIKSIEEMKSEVLKEEGDIVKTSISEETLSVFGSKDNKKLWEFKANAKITSLPSVKEDTLCFGSWDGKIYSLDPLTGEKKWDFETGWGVVTKPAVTENLVLFGSLDNNFYAVDRNNGEIEWSFTCNAGIQSSPAVYGEYVFFGCDDGVLYALNQKTGNLGWKFKPKYSIEENMVQNYLTTPINSDPVIDNGTIYISVEDTLYALDTQTTESEKSVDQKQVSTESYAITTIVISCLVALLLLMLYIRKYRK